MDNKKNVKKKNVKINKNKKSTLKNKESMSKKKFYLTLTSILFLSILLIFSTYAWFSTTLNVKITTFNMLVAKNAGLEISFDAVNYAQSLEISEDILFNDVAVNYPNHKSFWSTNGLFPVSTIGNKSRNSYFFDIYRSPGVKYFDLFTKEDPYIQTRFYSQEEPKRNSGFLAFDLFFKNDNNESPTPDNLYFDYNTGVIMLEELSEQMQGLVNSFRIGIVKVGSLPMDATPTQVQNIQCNHQCQAIIFEPYSKNHTQMSIDKASKYGITLVDGEYFPTYANITSVDHADIENTISGSPTLDTTAFALQETITENEFDEPLFTIPHGITKTRVYVWIEGGDIDNIETDSEGAEVAINLNFVKDVYGWESYD